MSLTIPLAALLCVPALQASMASQPMQILSSRRYSGTASSLSRSHESKELRECVNKHSIFAGRNPSGEQCAGCTVACDGMFLWCVYRRWLS